MGVLRFLMTRGLDFVIPGAGLAIDLIEATMVVKEALDNGKICQDVYESYIEALESAAECGEELEEDGKKIKIHKRACSICRKPGHNKRTCPNR